MTRRVFVQSAIAVAGISHLRATKASGGPTEDKLVVLTFDDAVKSHLTVAAPLLKELGFGATFFVTHLWMDDTENFMSWDDIAELHRMGFEIGNHTWTHESFAKPRAAARLEGNLALVEYELAKVGVPTPISFAYPGNQIGPEMVDVLVRHGLKFGRRGMAPEVDYTLGTDEIGPTFVPSKHHRLSIPSTGVPDPTWTMERLKQTVAQAKNGEIVVLQFHGVPDIAHPWVYLGEDDFRQYMAYLKKEGFRCVAMRDLGQYVDVQGPVQDPVLQVRVPASISKCDALAVEVEATQADLSYWLENMIRGHRYTWAEVAAVAGLTVPEVRKQFDQLGLEGTQPESDLAPSKTSVLPYPGGRHPRIGFLEGAYDPLRGTKASVFLPWDRHSYVVIDLPEAIHSNLGMLFLAHTHIPTVWDEQDRVLENRDWTKEIAGGLSCRWALPNGISFGASIEPEKDGVALELWLKNVTYSDLTNLRGQVCVMFKGAAGFHRQTNENKIFRKSAAATRSDDGKHWVLTAWERVSRTVGNPQLPCMHVDPLLPDCPAGHTVRTRGRLWFYEGDQITSELEKAESIG